MGDELKNSSTERDQLRRFTRCLLNDLHALEEMLSGGMVESGTNRIGAEQEMVLIDKYGRPAPVGGEVLEAIDDPRFTFELARFNVEYNLDPMSFSGDCLSRMHAQLDEGLATVRAAAEELEAEVLLIGILPTLRKRDMNLGNMTRNERFTALNDATNRMRGSAFGLNIKGTDELILNHDNVMLEAANTSFQIHFQVSPENFAHYYNIAQTAAGPVLAAAVNSPFLGRYRLWRETRIAVFQQSIDTRKAPHERKVSPRVHFGNKWVDNSVLEIYQEDVARYKVLLGVTIDEDSLAVLKEGGVPQLQALRMHNGTIYRWNRACYGICEGKPHLRIENRVLPAGPTTIDEVANAAFWFGLLRGLSSNYDDITKVMQFEQAHDNFFAAARHGLAAQFRWVGGKVRTAKDLILTDLLPLAREGLRTSKIKAKDISLYLGVIEERVQRELTGAQWMLSSFEGMAPEVPDWEKLHALTSASLARQKEGKPVHQWPLAKVEDGGGWEQNYLRVEQYMTTDIFTVQPHEPIDLVALLMVWNRIRHVLVEDGNHKLIGVVSHRRLLRLFGQSVPQEEGESAPVSTIMVEDPLQVTPETTSLDAIRLMRKHRISCLPVVDEEQLVGVVTEDNFLAIAADLLEQKLGSELLDDVGSEQEQ